MVGEIETLFSKEMLYHHTQIAELLAILGFRLLLCYALFCLSFIILYFEYSVMP